MKTLQTSSVTYPSGYGKKTHDILIQWRNDPVLLQVSKNDRHPLSKLFLLLCRDFLSQRSIIPYTSDFDVPMTLLRTIELLYCVYLEFHQWIQIQQKFLKSRWKN